MLLLLLLLEKWIVARLALSESSEAVPGRIDKGTRGRVLGGDAQVARVAERIHALARREQGVESRVLRVLFLGGADVGREEGGGRVEVVVVELCLHLLLDERIERRSRVGRVRLRPVER